MGSVSVDMAVSWPLEGGHPPEMFDPPTMEPVMKHFVSVECMNGAAQTKVCNTPPPIFHVDTTAPACNDAHVKASSRAYCDEIVSRGVRCTVGSNCQTNGAKW